MKPKRHFGFGNLNYSDPSCYIQYEKLDFQRDCPKFNKVINNGEVCLTDISKLQIETEKATSILGYRMMHLKSLLEGNPMKRANGLVKNLNKSSQYLSFITLPNEENGKTIVENDIKKAKEELTVKSDPDKPLTLIISQNRRETRRTSQNIGNKRQLIDESPETKPKRQKSLPVNVKNEKDTKSSYEVPNRFWELMEPYCTEINEEHIRILEEYINCYDDDMKYYQVPDCGSCLNDRPVGTKIGKGMPQRRQTNQAREEINLNGFLNKGSVELSNLLKKIDNEIRKPLSQTKSLKNFPQHLVSKMSQETDDLITFHKSQILDLKNNISSEASGVSKSLAKQLKVSNSYKLERHIKKSMDDLGMCDFNLPFIPKLEPQFNLCHNGEQQGIAKSCEADIIDPSFLVDNDYVKLHLPNSKKIVDSDTAKEDKALIGLKRRQAELKLVSESNLGMLRRLLVVAKRDMKRQEIERRLALADADVIESYNVIESYRPTHRAPLKKDRDSAYKAIKERQKILKELDAFDAEFL